MTKVYELNMDGLVGPTHHYAGLSEGNIASTSNALKTANPQAAALQGLEKMRLLFETGFKQALLLPQQRPNLELLHQLGFRGTPAQQLSKAKKEAPELLSAAYSASCMWTANAATVSASIDTADHKVHFTAANLISNLHRHQEADFSSHLLKTIFKNEDYFRHHPVLPRSSITGDEGAANHNRFCAKHGQEALYLYVYGKQALSRNPNQPHPLRFPARQTLEASSAIARSHQLNPDKVMFACQNPKVIDQGVFHNDVISVANESVFLVHEEAFVNQADLYKELQRRADFDLQIIEIKSKDLSIQDAVASYFFNSQLISLMDGSGMMLIAPSECETNPRVKSVIDSLLEDSANPINKVHYLDLKQSMQNGGGPACLRLRVALNEDELKAMHQGVIVDGDLLDKLQQWVLSHYRNELHAQDLDDPQLIDEGFRALDKLTQILDLGAIYPFQR